MAYTLESVNGFCLNGEEGRIPTVRLKKRLKWQIVGFNGKALEWWTKMWGLLLLLSFLLLCGIKIGEKNTFYDIKRNDATSLFKWEKNEAPASLQMEPGQLETFKIQSLTLL